MGHDKSNSTGKHLIIGKLGDGNMEFTIHFTFVYVGNFLFSIFKNSVLK